MASLPAAAPRDDPGAASTLESQVRADLELAASAPTEPVVAAAWTLRALIMAGERYRVELVSSLGLGASESQAIGYLLVHGARGQSELAGDLGLTSSAATALVDRLEARDVAVRTRHSTDRRRFVVSLTARGEQLAAQSQALLLDTLDVIPDPELALLTLQLARMAERLQGQSRPAGRSSNPPEQPPGRLFNGSRQAVVERGA